MIQATINLRVLDALSLFASKDKHRPTLQGVCVEVDARSVTYVALDGSRLISYRHDLEPDEEDQTLYGVFTIPTTHCKAFKLEKDDDGKAILSEANADRLTIAHGTTDITFMPLDCFPDWRKVLPRTVASGVPAQFRSALMKDLGKICKLLELGDPFIAHDGKERPAFIWFSGRPHVLGLICPIKTVDEMAREAPQWARRGPEREQGDIEDFVFAAEDEEEHDPETGELEGKAAARKRRSRARTTESMADAAELAQEAADAGVISQKAADETERITRAVVEKYGNGAIPEITVHMDQKCAECGEKGTADSGICMDCTTKAIQGKPMKSVIGRAVQQRARATLDHAKAARVASGAPKSPIQVVAEASQAMPGDIGPATPPPADTEAATGPPN